MIMDKLVDAATWIKVSSEEPVFGALYAKSIEEIDPKLAYTIAVLPFESRNKVVKEFLFSKSDIVRATGGEQARRRSCLRLLTNIKFLSLVIGINLVLLLLQGSI